MPIDQMGLNSITAIVSPKNSLDALREKREGIWKKLNKEIDDNNLSVNNKQVILELQATDNEIQQAIYEEKSRKLELEGLKIEEATAKTARKRKNVLAKHECVLYNASMGKLLSAEVKYFGFRNKAGMTLLHNEEHSQTDNNLIKKAEEINRDIKESTEFGIAKAEVARRRNSNIMKQNDEEAINKNAAKRRKNRKGINITV